MQANVLCSWKAEFVGTRCVFSHSGDPNGELGRLRRRLMVSVRLVLLRITEIINSCHYYFIELIFISLKVMKSATNDKILQEISDILLSLILM